MVTALAPIAWGSNYYVTHRYLPAGSPLYGGALRALPAGLLLLASTRTLPRGAWWGRALVLGTLNMGAFFVLIYVAAQRLPTSIAATVMATSPIALMAAAWLLLGERPRAAALAGAGLGLSGVSLLLAAGGTVDLIGVAASIAAMVMSSAGYVLTKRWATDVDVITVTAWQLLAGGATLLPLAVVIEGAPPPVGVGNGLAFVYVAVVATALAFVAWFTGLRHLRAADVGLIGLLNPVTGALLGTIVAGEVLTPRQLGGLALVLAGVLLGARARADQVNTGRRGRWTSLSKSPRVLRTLVGLKALLRSEPRTAGRVAVGDDRTRPSIGEATVPATRGVASDSPRVEVLPDRIDNSRHLSPWPTSGL